ncbi:MAG: NAD(P)-dependent oxidoreductase [Nocardioides sp.]|nr:NAD(P)-dependent oxidoreductase [Nocardioides sp.]
MLAVTGSTGALGGLVARAVADLDPVLLVRDASRAPDLGCEVRVAGYSDVGAAATLHGVRTLFMVSGSESATRRAEHRAFVDAAVRAGVRHVVYTSFAGASPDATFTLGRDHHDTEQALAKARASEGMTTTVLRDNFYADLLPLFADEVGVLRGPAGSGADAGRVAAVARADVAAVAEAVLRDPGAHAGATYTLTGPEALTLDEIASRAGAVLDRPLTYHPETVEEAWASRRAAYPGTPDWQVEAWVSTYTAIADGSVAEVTDDVRRVTGQAPRTLEDALRG